jgi:2-dehydro-3-deoxy-D-arabinonate dehydratase
MPDVQRTSTLSQIVRFATADGRVVVGMYNDGVILGTFGPQSANVASLLQLRKADFRKLVEATTSAVAEQPWSEEALRAPIDGATEVWAAGVTYQRSEEARVEESDTPDIYTKVYRAERPELFFKATPRRVAGPWESIVVRADSSWDVPEPELALVINAHAEIVGYTVANDVSSRTIEGENPLYLPQAKVYARSCALGPGITPEWSVEDPYGLAITMSVSRRGDEIWRGDTNTRELKRRLDDLVAYLFRENEYPDGVILCTGTGLVPDSPFTLEHGDVVEIQIERLGTLRNPVVRGFTAATVLA